MIYMAWVDSKSVPMGPKSIGPKFYQKMNFKKGFCDFIFLNINNEIDISFYKIKSDICILIISIIGIF